MIKPMRIVAEIYSVLSTEKAIATNADVTPGCDIDRFVKPASFATPPAVSNRANPPRLDNRMALRFT